MRGGADHARPGRRAGRGIEDVVARRAVLGTPDARVDAGRGDAAAGELEPVGGLAGERMADVDLERSVDPQIAAAVDRPPLAARQLQREQVGGEALAGAAGVEPDARFARDRVVADADARPASGRVGAGRAPRRRGRERVCERELRRAARPVVPGGLELGGERRIDEAAGQFRRHQPGRDCGPQQRRGRHVGRGRRVQAAELAVGPEPAQRGVEVLERRAARGRRRRRRGRAAGCRCPCSRRCGRS